MKKERTKARCRKEDHHWRFRTNTQWIECLLTRLIFQVQLIQTKVYHKAPT